MNKVMLTGNLTADPEMRALQDGTELCKFRIAVTRGRSTNGEKTTDFFNITAWRELAKTCGKYLKKGKKVGIIGKLRVHEYEKDGTRHERTEVEADEIEFLSKKDSE